MPRDYRAYLDDISDAIAKIRDYTKGFSASKLKKDAKTLDAVVRNLEIIGEAAKNIPAELRAKQTALDWQRIAGLRDILAHRYFKVDVEIIWDIVQNKLPALDKAVEEMLK